jgi:hypothetical protein
MTAHCRKVRSLSAWTPVPGGRLYDIPLLYQRHCVVTGARRAWLIASYAGHEPRLNRRRYRRIASRAGPHHRERSIPILATHSDAQRDPRKDPAGAATRAFAAGEALRAAARYSGQKAAGGALALKSEPGRPATLGSSAAAGVRLIVWCRDCGHQVEADPAEQAQRYGAEMTVPEWRDRLVCSKMRQPRDRYGGYWDRAPGLASASPSFPTILCSSFADRRIDCHCMFETASGQLQARGTM